MTTGAILIALILMTAAAFLALEAWAYMTGRPLITTQIRQWNRATHGLVGFLFGLTGGLLAGHFFWCGGG